MNMPACPDCGAELGPWEGDRCVQHMPGHALTIADQAVLVLEGEPGPVYLHDIQRGIERELGRRTEWQTVSSVVGADRRFCWSGKGMYALFRHGRIPSVRTLADAASFMLLAADEPLAASELSFVMKWSGYRFQDTSLMSALNREARFNVGWEPRGALSPEGWKVSLRDAHAERERAEVMRIPRPAALEALLDHILRGANCPPVELWPVDVLVDRWRVRVAEGLGERSRRLGFDP